MPRGSVLLSCAKGRASRAVHLKSIEKIITIGGSSIFEQVLGDLWAIF